VRSKDKGECGVLMHISSLPSKYGIGTLGREAYNFVDFLCEAGQRYWQILPVVPVGEGNSPYKSSSCFAGEILFIDLELLVRDGLLLPDELPPKNNGERIDYDKVRKEKLPLLQLAAERFDKRSRDYKNFLLNNSEWLENYATFACIAAEYGELLSRFPQELRYRLPSAMEGFRLSHREQLDFYRITQYLFYKQYFELKSYVDKKGLQIIGDIPFYISLDSADVWQNPDAFKLGRDFTPVRVAGVPPDRFSQSGQLWGNPVYDWDFHRKTNYGWWKKRLKFCSKLYDVLRIDHFRAFASYYSIPYGAPDARNGVWEHGPGMSFWKSVEPYCGDLMIIAEDLGGEEPDVEALVQESGFPNMKVVQFCFDGESQNRFLPKNYNRNCVCYTGTHDNETALGWYNEAPLKQKLYFDSITPKREKNPSLRMIDFAMRSRSALVVIPMQDWLCLDNSARMNTPGSIGDNWEWKMSQDTDYKALSEIMRRICTGREKGINQ